MDGDYTFDFGWDLEDRDGEQFAKIKDHKFDYDVERVHYQLNNLFHGNKYLGKTSPCGGGSYFLYLHVT